MGITPKVLSLRNLFLLLVLSQAQCDQIGIGSSVQSVVGLLALIFVALVNQRNATIPSVRNEN
jgi:hypothetical protein